MSITIAITHRTEYTYERPISLAPQTVRLRPAPHTRTPLHQYSMKVEPAGHFINWQQDPFGNYLARLVFPRKTSRLLVEVDLVAELVTINPFDFFLEEYAEKIPFQYTAQERKQLQPYFELRDEGPLLRNWLASVDREPAPTVDFLVALNQRVQQDVSYLIRLEPGTQSCEETLRKGSGSCRDSAWLLVQILRHLNLAARFVSGYLVQLTADQAALDGPSGPSEDFTDLHAWAEVYLPGAGWVGLDATSGLFAGEGHLPLACAPDPLSAAPISGAVEPCESTLHFTNQVRRIRETARVTRPYTDAQWQAIDALGQAVDQQLQRGDVRLTQGGEPTFVSIDDMDSPEWNIQALGQHKRERAEVLTQRLREQLAPQGVVHESQGKWYPGEPLPRWALSLYWREDGLPLWSDARWLSGRARPLGHQVTDAERFLSLLGDRLGLPVPAPYPAFEDAFYYLWKEGTLPENLDVIDNRLTNPLERERVRRVFEQGLDQPVGYVLPLAWESSREGWCSSPWRFRRGRLFLLPGDSPMGLRLPLDSLIWEEPQQQRRHQPRDPYDPRQALPDPRDQLYQRYHQRPETLPYADPGIHPQVAADRDSHREGLVRTALCAEVRDGCLHIFLPPVTHLEHYIDLIHAVEQCAARLELPVVLEGYDPPDDPRLCKLQVTPDPGVIEVNVPPSSSWSELQRSTEQLYEEARLARLGTEKFMLDGRHTGTGGGNHVTIGGRTPTDSPILRRPHLLRSLISFWQHHPSLSYLFSGLFIGPTSQAPRVDEARDEQLYELEIAFSQLPEGDAPSPWAVDRALRNLLIDITGNTHRAEFCIDKLYSPDTPVGRRGLVEFRGFEMPPHARMSLVQMLLLRALIAHFWDHPYQQRPVRWGTALHDRFMLPHFVMNDFNDVLDRLRSWGFPFEPAWFDPFYEFRFPHYGKAQIGDVQIDLRLAVEPWNVLGEEVSAQGTARYVDSSVERVQVTLSGATPGRHLLTCNGRRVPLQPTARQDQLVAGVRFKAWNPPSSLHATLGAQAPLTFDLIDLWSQRSLGGCTYHVSHPGGRSHDDLPVNAKVAESRRLARFEAFGHSAGPVLIPDEMPNPEYPCTLDLRRPPRLR